IADNSGNRYLWDPSEPVATRPLVWLHGGNTYSYTHDGNKNVSELVDAHGTVTAHYEYAPFGDVTVSAGNLASSTPFRFSSEYADDALGLVYYNYRHYDPVTGRWTSRDLIEEFGGINIYCMIGNFPAGYTDFLGFENLCDCIEITVTSVYRCNWRYFTYADYDFNPVNKGQSVPYFIDDTGLFGLKHKDRIMWVSVEVVPKEIQGTEKCHCEDIYYGAYKHCPIVVIKSMNGITKERVWNIVFNMNGESTYDRYITQYVPEYESPFISPYSITVYIDDDICEKLEFSISY
ncbi:MAG: RHS repeat-associated core domain-containing protein, partial [Kiritimatiellae bacterium]|nr:RHS repeat-associated core domain-containing protein [Kiritimatiellia bacterium]